MPSIHDLNYVMNTFVFQFFRCEGAFPKETPTRSCIGACKNGSYIQCCDEEVQIQKGLIRDSVLSFVSIISLWYSHKFMIVVKCLLYGWLVFSVGLCLLCPNPFHLAFPSCKNIMTLLCGSQKLMKAAEFTSNINIHLISTS